MDCFSDMYTDFSRYHLATLVTQPVIDLFIDYAWETLHHPTYNPDLSPPDFDLFPKLKEHFAELIFKIWISSCWL